LRCQRQQRIARRIQRLAHPPARIRDVRLLPDVVLSGVKPVSQKISFTRSANVQFFRREL